jgi:hypothetical protein
MRVLRARQAGRVWSIGQLSATVCGDHARDERILRPRMINAQLLQILVLPFLLLVIRLLLSLSLLVHPLLAP